MATDNRAAQLSEKKMNTRTSRTLEFHEIGKGFIVERPSPEMRSGRKLITAYADQFGRQYAKINGSYEPITVSHDYLKV